MSSRRSNRCHPQSSSPSQSDNQFQTQNETFTSPRIKIVQIRPSVFVEAEKESFRSIVQNLTGRKRNAETEENYDSPRTQLNAMNPFFEVQKQTELSAKETFTTLNEVAVGMSTGEPKQRNFYSPIEERNRPDTGSISLPPFVELNSSFSSTESMTQPAFVNIIAHDYHAELQPQFPAVYDGDIFPVPPILWDWQANSFAASCLNHVNEHQSD